MSPRSEAVHELLQNAVDLAARGDWQSAHVIVQEHESDEIACWIHAIVHRMEGDLANAGYWYRRCGRALRDGVSPAVELREVEAALRH